MDLSLLRKNCQENLNKFFWNIILGLKFLTINLEICFILPKTICIFAYLLMTSSSASVSSQKLNQKKNYPNHKVLKGFPCLYYHRIHFNPVSVVFREFFFFFFPFLSFNLQFPHIPYYPPAHSFHYYSSVPRERSSFSILHSRFSYI